MIFNLLTAGIGNNRLHMIGWIYSDPIGAGSWRVVTLSYQKISEGTKTIVDTSNRCRVVSNVVCDDFMQLERPLGAEQLPSRLAAPCGASPSTRVRGHSHPASSEP